MTWASRLTRKPNNFSAKRSWPSWMLGGFARQLQRWEQDFRSEKRPRKKWIWTTRDLMEQTLGLKMYNNQQSWDSTWTQVGFVWTGYPTVMACLRTSFSKGPSPISGYPFLHVGTSGLTAGICWTTFHGGFPNGKTEEISHMDDDISVICQRGQASLS